MKFVTDCTADLTAKVKSVKALNQKTITVLSVDDLTAQLLNVVKPAAGILYEGARPAPADGGKQITVSVEVVYSILLLCETSVVSSKIDSVSPAHALLDAVRGEIHGSRSPTGHLWKWVMEAPAAQKGSLQVWVQRWSCHAQLPPKS